MDETRDEAPHDEAAAEMRRHQLDLECVVGMASAMPRRAPGPLTVRPFRELIRRT